MNDYKKLIERLTYLEKGSYENCPIIVYGNVCKEYFDKQEERFAKHASQTSLFVDGGF